MKNSFYFLIFLFAVSGFVFVVSAQEEVPPGVTFPVAELGNCASRAECEAYCDLAENMSACLDFAETHGLISPEELAMARKMLELGVTAGPGGCQGQAECAAYCDDINNIEECIAFAERYGLIPPDELAEGKKVAAAIKQGIKPPNCKNKTECDVYCRAPENMEECITFGEAAGLIPPEELEMAKKILELMQQGIELPPCRGDKECDEYCAIEEHFEECITFAEAAGFVSPEEAAMARKTGGKGPGDCRGKEECDAFCEDPANMEECINFGEEFGFMSHEEAENARKMLAAGFTGGPGGCKGQKECEAYCEDLAHLEECVDFAEKMGFMSSEDAARAREMAQRGINVMQGGPGGCKGDEECRAFCEDPANMEECLNFAVQIGEMTPEDAERAKKGMKMIQTGGLGGCRSEEECRAYCDDPAHGIECMNYAIEHGLVSPEEAQQMQQQIMQMQQMQQMQRPEEMMPPEGMPTEGGFPPGFEGKCSSPEECVQYCLQNLQDPACQAMMPAVPPGTPSLPLEMPPEGTMPEEVPQSFFERVQQFLASVGAAIGIPQR